MANTEKASDAVRITRIVAPTALIIVLALVFKSEIGGSMKRGCFEISIEQAGLDFSDQSLCTMTDVNDFAGNMAEIGAETAEQRADSAFMEFENEINRLVEENNRLITHSNELAEGIRQNDKLEFEFARSLERTMNRTANESERNATERMYNAYVEMFNVPRTQREDPVQDFEPVNVQEVKSVSSGIRQRYIQKSQVDVEQVQKTIRVKRK